MLKYWLVEKYLNKTGNGFCLEKWNSSTLHLGTGMEHGCHHPDPVQIPLTELTSPEALTNHKHKQIVRQQMLYGAKPKECDYCWRSNGTQDRVIQSSNWYNLKNSKITGTTSTPKYLEVSFGNVCNLACAYCGPSFSSVWQQEIEQQGTYPDDYHKHYVKPIPNNQHNPYIEAFWKWWPELKEQLMYLRITGGEPLMSKHTYTLLEQCKDINVTVNTNLCVDKKLLDKFCDAAKQIKKLTISVSGESTNERAEYARHGLVYKDFLENLVTVHERLPNAKIQVMSVYNCLCVTTFADFLKDVKQRVPNIMLSVSRLHNPDFFDHRLINEGKQESLQYVKSNFNTQAYKRFENIIKDNSAQNLPMLREKLINFTTEFDKRRNTNFSNTFPEFSAPPRSTQ